ncbi:hypothetical protein GCM10023116_04820 [Kistimonas scapharcae]|uniref:Uncharacterized protein n=1 Tax=Kistimonas scapharcae TaxID=1036133 RepID=A0ABP8UZC7_9GAMM
MPIRSSREREDVRIIGWWWGEPFPESDGVVDIEHVSEHCQTITGNASPWCVTRQFVSVPAA